MDYVKPSPIILDCGTHSCKVGFAEISKRAPDCVFDTSEPFLSPGGDSSLPISNGQFEKWDSLEHLWEYALKTKMKIEPSEHSILLSENEENPPESRQKMLQTFFETFRVQALHLGSQGLLSLYSVGLTSGLVIQSGHSWTTLIAVRDGHRPTYGRLSVNYTGQKMTEYTQELIAASLREDHNLDTQTVDFKLAEKFKENNGRVGLHKGEKTASDLVSLEFAGKHYSLDAGEIGAKIGEAMFTPSILGLSCLGLADAVKECIILVDDEDWMDEVYLKSIVLAGGNTLFTGLRERLAAEVDKVKFLPFMMVDVKAPPYRHFSSWVGGSVIASLPTFKPSWITKEDYEEFGTSILCQKCLPY